jgi:hypothetical protein
MRCRVTTAFRLWASSTLRFCLDVRRWTCLREDRRHGIHLNALNAGTIASLGGTAESHEQGQDQGQVVDLTFPSDVLRKLRPELEALGFTITQETIGNPISWYVVVSITTLKREMELIYLIHLNREVIDADKPKLIDLQATAFLEYCVPEDGSLVIMSRRLDAPSPPVRQIIDEWKKRRMNLRFVAWREIKELPPPGTQARLVALTQILGVAESTLAGTSLKKIEHVDLQAIVKIMTDLASTAMNGPEQFFKNLIERTVLPPKMQASALAGWKPGSLPGDYARELAQWAMARGRFTSEGERASLTVLGEIIKELAEESGNDEKLKLYEIAKRYQLLDDLTIKRIG